MSTDPNCPKCNSENVYSDGNLWICPECAHEWSVYASEVASEVEVEDNTIRDAHGNALNNGDAVTVIKELKIKGSSSVVKVGTKVRNIRLVDGDDGHNIACKIDGLGSINLKSEFVKKA
jgi:protein PhnA